MDVMECARRAFEAAGVTFEIEEPRPHLDFYNQDCDESEHRLIFHGRLCSIVQDHECNSSLRDLYAPNNEPESRA